MADTGAEIPGVSGEVVEVKLTQAKLDEIVQGAMARAGKDSRAEAQRLQEELAATKQANDALKAEVDRFKAIPAKTSKESKTDEDERIAEMARVNASLVAERDEARRLISQREAAIQESEARIITVRKQVAMQEAAAGVGFVDPNLVFKDTDDRVQWSTDRGKFVVVNEQGTERLNSSYEPMSLVEFYTEYAAKKPFMVRGEVRTGVGSGVNNPAVGGGNGRFQVEQIFGPKSDSRKAQALIKSDPKQYAELRKVAVENGLISARK